jgi:hypothetical protein
MPKRKPMQPDVLAIISSSKVLSIVQGINIDERDCEIVVLTLSKKKVDE